MPMPGFKRSMVPWKWQQTGNVDWIAKHKSLLYRYVWSTSNQPVSILCNLWTTVHSTVQKLQPSSSLLTVSSSLARSAFLVFHDDAVARTWSLIFGHSSRRRHADGTTDRNSHSTWKHTHHLRTLFPAFSSTFLMFDALAVTIQCLILTRW